VSEERKERLPIQIRQGEDDEEVVGLIESLVLRRSDEEAQQTQLQHVRYEI